LLKELYKKGILGNNDVVSRYIRVAAIPDDKKTIKSFKPEVFLSLDLSVSQHEICMTV
jgi:hypothetical protein